MRHVSPVRWLSRALPALSAALFVAGCSSPNAATSTRAVGRFVDESGCVDCHGAESRAWTGSHHDLAMQPASDQSVLGDFNDAHFSYAGVTSRFFRRDGRFFVTTDGPDGKAADFEIDHAFGFTPLQQYLISLPGGRLQALSIAWDTKKKRWFHLYPGERVDFRDELHWTKPSQNWNYMCGECHATDYRKSYDAATGGYGTTAARFDVGCQACHGPASRHAEWAKRAGKKPRKRPPGEVKRDFDVDLAARDSRQQIDTCARCHSRRGTFSADYRHGAPLMDTHLPALLTEPLYHADGQILDEVYEYGSFLQSRMYAKGVRCSDCHDPHSMKLRAAGDSLCVTCHNAAAPAARAHIDTSGLKKKDYASAAHHFHKPGASGSHCVECHAPTRAYMVVDPRFDHSFRIPRPDLSVAIGTPNACNQCHARETSQWAADWVAKWYGPGRRREPHYGLTLDAGRLGKAGAVPGLVALADDRTQPAIVRATALDLLSRYPGRAALAALQGGLADPDPLVRRAAVGGQERLPPAERGATLAPLLDDSVRAVRMEAARLLAPTTATLSARQSKRLGAVLAEFEAAQTENADRPEANANLGNLYSSLGDTARAEAAYRRAIAVDSRFVPAFVNLADLRRAGGREADAERVLREGLRSAPGASVLHEALGLALVRQGRKREALAEFAAAVKAAPDDARHAYVYAVSLHDAGRRPEAMRLLEAVARRRGDRDVLLALASYSAEAGEGARAETYLRALSAINPDDPALPATRAER
ncbi:MAG TPA: tetratricopeptide repeat protein [Candidatus Eisenbacteria bacterium]|nr:tetratricopeptide repeat protein [Candidatus Eisenbacteria bacterium]